MKVHRSVSLLVTLAVFGCSNDDNPYDASGVFETTEVIVSSEANGKILKLSIEEGATVSEGMVIGQVDTVQLYLQKQQLEASRAAILSGRPDVRSQIEATEREIKKWEREKVRVEKLLAGGRSHAEAA